MLRAPPPGKGTVELGSAPADSSGAGWNLYAYSTNPLSQTDPTGLDDMAITDSSIQLLFSDSGGTPSDPSSWLGATGPAGPTDIPGSGLCSAPPCAFQPSDGSTTLQSTTIGSNSDTNSPSFTGAGIGTGSFISGPSASMGDGAPTGGSNSSWGSQDPLVQLINKTSNLLGMSSMDPSVNEQERLTGMLKMGAVGGGEGTAAAKAAYASAGGVRVFSELDAAAVKSGSDAGYKAMDIMRAAVEKAVKIDIANGVKPLANPSLSHDVANLAMQAAADPEFARWQLKQLLNIQARFAVDDLTFNY